VEQPDESIVSQPELSKIHTKHKVTWKLGVLQCKTIIIWDNIYIPGWQRGRDQEILLSLIEWRG